MQIPFEVRAAWKFWLEGASCQPIAGGLSSSRVWRVQSALGQKFCLKAWPTSTIDEKRLSELHQFMAALGSQLSFIPKVLAPSLSTTSFWPQAEFYWELTTWLEGQPLTPENAQLSHGESAVQTIVQLHRSSKSWKSIVASSPSVATRIEALKSYHVRLPALRKLAQSTHFGTLAHETLSHFESYANQLLEQLNRLRNPVELMWVVRDLHREHMLYEGTTVTGVIDYGAARLDEPLIDLTRFLGSLWPLNRDMRYLLIECFSKLTGQTGLLPRYRVLDHSSTLLSAMQWLQWLVVESRVFSVDQQQLLERWRQLNTRLACNHW